MPLFNSITEGTTSMGDVVNVCDYITNFPIATCPINDCDNQSNGLIISGQYYDLYTIIKETDCAAVGIILTSALSIGTLNCVAGDVTAPISITFNDITSFANGTEIVLNTTNTVAPISVSSVVAPLSGFTYNSTTQTITITDDSLITNTFAFDVVFEYADCNTGFILTGVVNNYNNLNGSPTIGTQTGDSETYSPAPLDLCSPTLQFLTAEANFTTLANNSNIYELQVSPDVLDYDYSINWGDGSPIESGTVLTTDLASQIQHTYANGTFTPTFTFTNTGGQQLTYLSSPLIYSGGTITSGYLTQGLLTSANVVSQANCNTGSIDLSFNFDAQITEDYTNNLGGPYNGDGDYELFWNGISVATGTWFGINSGTLTIPITTNNIFPINTATFVVKQPIVGDVFYTINQTILTQN